MLDYRDEETRREKQPLTSKMVMLICSFITFVLMTTEALDLSDLKLETVINLFHFNYSTCRYCVLLNIHHMKASELELSSQRQKE